MIEIQNSLISSLQVSANGRYFIDRQGNPAFWLGDTQWELFRMFNPEQARSILQNRQRKGFNVILIMLTGVEAGLVEKELMAPYVNLEGEVSWSDGDPLKPNEAYFQHVDRMIRLGEETGQTYVVGVFHQWHKDIITLEKARPWARWVAHRYRHVPNLIWSMYPRATPEYIPICRELAAGLQQGDGGRHLISVHPDPSVASSSFLHAEPWLAFNMIQTCIDYDRIWEAVSSDYRRTPVKPVVMAEGGYEGVEFGKLQTAWQIRKQAYWTQLAGGHHVYGHNESWRLPRSWDLWIDAPGSYSLSVFRELITSLPAWWDLIPDQSLFASGTGRGDSLNLAARSAQGDWILVYLSEPCKVSLHTGSLNGQVKRAWWIDPVRGERTPAEVFQDAGIQAFTTPRGWDDSLLLMEGDTNSR
jgi:hypothetical protein